MSRPPWLDHLLRAVKRYQTDGGSLLAAGLTYYGFLSVLPLLLVAMSALGYLLNNDPEMQADIVRSISEALPGVGDSLVRNLAEVQQHRQATGLIGLAGLVYAGFGGVDALRDALRTMWHQDRKAGNIVTSKLNDLLTIAGLGLTLLVSFAITAFGAGLGAALLDAAGVEGTGAKVVLSLLALALALVADTALFVYLFRRLPRINWPLRQVIRGAVFGAVGFGLLKLVATTYVGRVTTRSTELYGVFGAVIGILVGINLICRLLMFTAAWTVTAPGAEDVLPSGTAPGAPEDERSRAVPVPIPARPPAPARTGLLAPAALAGLAAFAAVVGLRTTRRS